MTVEIAGRIDGMEDSGYSAPYVPFPTFETGLNKLAHLGGIPPRIDSTVFTQMGGAQVSQVISALKFFGLVNGDGIPDPALAELVLNRESRKKTIRALIKKHYPNISESDLATMSLGQLDSKLADKSYRVTGATKQKARSFLLKAAEFAEIPLSKLLKAKGPRGPRKTGAKRVATTNDKNSPPSGQRREPLNGQTSGDQRTVQLANGGTVTLLLDVSLLALKGKDREFVFELIDKLDAYETKP